jgi:hypothetical protein
MEVLLWVWVWVLSLVTASSQRSVALIAGWGSTLLTKRPV